MSGSHLIARHDGVLCTVCGTIDPVHCGDGTPLPAIIAGYQGCVERHPPVAHQPMVRRPAITEKREVRCLTCGDVVPNIPSCCPKHPDSYLVLGKPRKPKR